MTLLFEYSDAGVTGFFFMPVCLCALVVVHAFLWEWGGGGALLLPSFYSSKHSAKTGHIEVSRARRELLCLHRARARHRENVFGELDEAWSTSYQEPRL